MMLEELGATLKEPLKIYYDNKAVIDILHNLVYHDRIKHVEVDRHFIKEKIDERVISITHVLTSDQVADILTKGLHKPTFENL